jgi:alkanesulfonate monooxygenase SsuD/methylene tetrahydromethanopterin reductase-like flavin-dependent oxidoreductase (luciferase family)
MPDIAVSVQAAPVDLRSWLSLARRLESSGFRGLLMGDHPGSGASPWPALGSAAAVTQTLQLGTYVVQAGVREPVHVAADAATLDILAPGRVLLGLGAGHTPREWTDIGRERPGPSQRAERLAEFAAAVAALLRGQAVSREGGYVALRESRLEDLPVGERVKLAVGGGHPLLLRAAARHADVVALSGLGRTLPDGHITRSGGLGPTWTASCGPSGRKRDWRPAGRSSRHRPLTGQRHFRMIIPLSRKFDASRLLHADL